MTALTDIEKRAVAFGLQFALELAHAGKLELLQPEVFDHIDVTNTQQAFTECLEIVDIMPEDMVRESVDGLIALGGPRLVEAWGRPR